MRRTLTVCRTGLTAAAALVLLSACGGDSGNSNDAASSSSAETTSSSAENTGSEADSEFCTQAQALATALDSAFDPNATDPAAVAQQFQQSADAVRDIEAPAEISDDWEKLATALEQISAAYADYTPGDPASQTALAQALQDVQTDAATSGAGVAAYLTDKCGIDTGVTESATPTS